MDKLYRATRYQLHILYYCISDYSVGQDCVVKYCAFFSILRWFIMYVYARMKHEIAGLNGVGRADF
jgi:hypothetical protein